MKTAEEKRNEARRELASTLKDINEQIQKVESQLEHIDPKMLNELEAHRIKMKAIREDLEANAKRFESIEHIEHIFAFDLEKEVNPKKKEFEDSKKAILDAIQSH